MLCEGLVVQRRAARSGANKGAKDDELVSDRDINVGSSTDAAFLSRRREKRDVGAHWHRVVSERCAALLDQAGARPRL